MTRYLKGWKRVLDKDNTNRCNWYEFQAIGWRVMGHRQVTAKVRKVYNQTTIKTMLADFQ